MEFDKIAVDALNELGKAAAKEAWEKKSRLLPLLERVWSFFRGSSVEASKASNAVVEPPRGILILGPGGTGKTTLGRILAGDKNVLIEPPGFYYPDSTSETLPLFDAPGIEIVVAPGQLPRLNREFDRLATELVRGKFRGLILVVDYGHHAIESEWSRDHKLYDGNKKKFVADLVAVQLQEELDILEKLKSHLMRIPNKLWLLTVVLKQDLWAPQQKVVVDHYREGVWAAKINEIVKVVDQKLFYPQTVFACLHIQNYTTKNGRETLKKNASGYDSVRQRQSLEDLFRAFDALQKWEETP